MGIIEDSYDKFILWSKTFWAGFLAFLLSAGMIAVDFWDLVDPESMAFLRDAMGPELFGLFGLLVIFLRVVTRGPVRLKR